MNQERIFIDTNIFVYAYLENTVTDEKRLISRELIGNTSNPIIISTQVLNEFARVLLKHKINTNIIRDAVNILANECSISPTILNTVTDALQLHDRYRFSYWDCLILASAIENECTTLYTEDLQHNQIIRQRLRIINPFLL